MSKLRVVGVSIKSVLGAREYSFEPGKINIVRGRNGTGKSSILTAIQSGLGGGNLAKLQTVGAEDDAEVVLVLEADSGEEYRSEKIGKKTARVRKRVGDTAAFEDVARSQEFLTSLFDPRGCNPVAFLNAKDDERAEMLLEALDLKLDRGELDGIVGDLAEVVPQLPPGLHPLLEVDLVRDAIFNARTGVNRDLKNKLGAADQTKRNAPARVPEDPKAEIAQEEASVSELTALVAKQDAEAVAAEKQAITEADGAYELAEQQAAATFKESSAKVRAEMEKRIAEIRAEADGKVSLLQDAGKTAVETAEKARDEAREQARRKREASRFAIDAKRRDLAQHRESLAGLRGQAEASAAARALLAQAKQFEDEAAGLDEKARTMTATIDALEALKRRLAEHLPIPGLEIQGKEIKVDGVPFEQINKSQRIDIAVRVAALRAKAARLPVLFVDDAESLDDDTFKLFVDRISQEDVQLFCGRVETHDLEVATA